ncbi:MAG: SPASM domain-containing protein [Candidatus Wallbacteria bacterium]|nr:SPASM domain-containing protein [Candidatus Wallbacteria bacterium]
MKPSPDLQLCFTDYCNFHCVMCLQSSHAGMYGSSSIRTPPLHAGRKGFISEELILRLISDPILSGINFRLLKAQWLGEALLHPDFFRLLSLLTPFFPEILISTNLSLLNSKKLGEFFALLEKSSHFTLLISLDSFNRETYKKIKGIDQLELVLSNLKELKKIRDLKKNCNLNLVLQMIVMEENQAEIRDFLVRASDFLHKPSIIYDQEAVTQTWKDKIFYKRLGAADQAKYELMHRNALIDSGLLPAEITAWDRIITTSAAPESGGKRRPCPAPFLTPTINWDGQVTVCCMDPELELKIGNLENQSLSEIWGGTAVNQLRSAHLSGSLSLYPRCLRCQNLDLLPLPEQTIFYWKKRLG